MTIPTNSQLIKKWMTGVAPRMQSFLPMLPKKLGIHNMKSVRQPRIRVKV